ncbi:LuxR family transcriptional regulator [Pseudomonas sp. SJZ079]|uniref:helix-turn-helix transcriptional regulator n=1 Tax=Pseudomonas sp. SJZ079 TaxID=2572887 RepID=UPI0011998EC4|nr:LuxR family transcriptional regulator [Pseudomonas sp. SJZ079]TWC32441.1 LuxR family transcriptional regulator [Pseudomonas sp. SJZ079]
MASTFHSRKDLVKLLELAQLCIKASSNKDDVDQVVALARSIIPFSALIVCLDNTHALNLSESRQLINYGYSEEWIELYFQRSFQHQDPVLLQSQCQDQAFTWQDSYGHGRQATAEFHALSRDFLGSNGLACAANGRGHKGSTLISMVLPDSLPAEEYVGALDYLVPHLHEIFNRPGELNRCSLMAPDISRRELEVLQWAKEGKSNWDISHILSISERTVKFHFGNIFRKLDVINRSQAIAKAMHYGVLTF